MTKAFVLVFLISLTTITSNAQSGCKAIDNLRPLLFLSFDSSDKQQIWLTLHNNTTCPIWIETNEELKESRELRLADGSSKIEMRSSPPDHDFVENEVLRDLIYELRDSGNDRLIKNTSTHQLIYLRLIPNGVNIRISLPLSSRNLAWRLRVPFRYEWEADKGPSMRGQATHQLYFSFFESR